MIRVLICLLLLTTCVEAKVFSNNLWKTVKKLPADSVKKKKKKKHKCGRSYLHTCSICGESHQVKMTKGSMWYECNGNIYFIKYANKK